MTRDNWLDSVIIVNRTLCIVAKCGTPTGFISPANTPRAAGGGLSHFNDQLGLPVE